MGATLLQPVPDRSTSSPPAASLDEARALDGSPRGGYASLFGRIDADAFTAHRSRIAAELEGRGVSFGGAESRPFQVDPVPRLIERGEWERVEAGLAQRTRALNAFLADVYGERRIVTAGVVPADLLDGADWYEPAMAEAGMPPVRAHVAGPDLVRGADGELRVLEDNLRAPSGLAYALAARESMAPVIEASGLEPRSLEPGVAALGEMLRAAAPTRCRGAAAPTVVLLNDGEGSAAGYEHRELARRLGLTLAAVGDLRRVDDRLLVVDGAGGTERRIDVIYRRVDDERLTGPDGRPTGLGGLLIGPLRAGSLACVNSPGSGVGDDKAIHTYVERMVGFYLDEPVLLESVRGSYLGEPGELERALPMLERLVIKPRSEFGGKGVVIGPLASPAELRAVGEIVRRDPARYVAQEPVALSLHPTVADGALEGRHVDLRPFVISSEDEVTVVPGGLTRFAREAGAMIVNSGQGGGAKDTWIL